MRLFVTGGTGYLGSVLVEAALAAGYDVRATVRSAAKAAVLPAAVEQVTCDLLDEDGLVKVMTGCDGVIHLAASLGMTPDEAARAISVARTDRTKRAAATRRAAARASMPAGPAGPAGPASAAPVR